MIDRAFRWIALGALALFGLTACGARLGLPVAMAGPPATAVVTLSAPHSAFAAPTASALATGLASPAAMPFMPTATATRDTRPDSSQQTIAVLGLPPSIATRPTVPPRASATPASPDCASTLQVCIAALVEDYEASGTAGVVITEGIGVPVVALNADRVFATASLYKLFVLWGVQRAIADGDMTDDTYLTFTSEDDDSAEDGYLHWRYGEQVSVAEARALMITASNNSAAWMLARTVGWGEIDRLLQVHGFSSSQTIAGESTPREIAALFDGIVTRSLDPRLRAADYELMLELLRDQQINSYLSTGLPDDADFAHKTGNLPGVVNDAGILFLPDGRTITIAVMTEGDEGASFELLREIAAAVWARYEP